MCISVGGWHVLKAVAPKRDPESGTGSRPLPAKLRTGGCVAYIVLIASKIVAFETQSLAQPSKVFRRPKARGAHEFRFRKAVRI
jgi:hypothetical protein